MAEQPTPTPPSGGRRFLRKLGGDRETLGWWTLPVFLIVGLAGAVLAGTFVVVWQTQKIQALEDEMADALAELREGVRAVEEAGDQALADIAAQVGDVEAAINVGLPVETAAQAGVALLRVDVPPQSAQAEPEPSQSQPVDDESAQPAPPPAATARVGSAVAVANDGVTTFFATSYTLVADPSRPGQVLDDISVDVGRGRVPAVVHSWDEARDIALLRSEVGAAILANWRPLDEPLRAGERAFLVGFTTTLDTVQQPGSVTFVDGSVLLTDHDVVGTLRGGALIDSDGRLLGIGSADYRPLVDDDRPANIPIHLLCERLLRACDDSPGQEPTDAPSEG